MLRAALLFTLKYLESPFMSKDLNSPSHLLEEMRKEISVCEIGMLPIQRDHPLVYVPLLLSLSDYLIFVTMLYYFNTYLSALSPLMRRNLLFLVLLTRRFIYLLIHYGLSRSL